MFGIMLVLTLVVFVAVTAIAYFYPGSDLDQAAIVLPFPRSLQSGVDVLGNLGGLLVVIFVANSIGSEYGRDTWKVIVPRYGSRSAFLLTKWIVGLVALLLLMAGVLVSAVVWGWLGVQLLGIANESSMTDTGQVLRTAAVMVFDFILIGTLTLCGTVVTRSTIGGVVIGFVSSTLLSLIGPLLSMLVTGASILSPTEHIDNLRIQWAMRDAEQTAMQAVLFNRPVSPLVSALVVISYIVLLLSVSMYLFKRRDMAGE
jgi:ABC-type transport system involved in multi-copper enzyme maturation permease subunit